MTQNQIAFARAKEEQRANRESERIKNFESGLKRTDTYTNMRNALTNYAEMERKRGLSFSEEMKNFGSAVKGFMSVFGPLTSLF